MSTSDSQSLWGSSLQIPALRFLFHAVFTCSYLVICPVVALPGNLPKPSFNLMNQTNPMNSTNSTNPPAPELYDYRYFDGPLWGPWGPGSWQCDSTYNAVLEETSEFNKWASSGASTIMALLPSLMAFAPAVTANLGFLCTLSTTQGLIAASFTFGLPVNQLDTWNQVKIRVIDLLVNLELHHENAITAPRPFSEMADNLLAPIKRMVLFPLPRRPLSKHVMFINLIFDCAQGILIFSLLFYVPSIETFYLIWLCPHWGSVVFNVWLAATFGFIGWVRARFERDSFGGDEIIYISKTNTMLGVVTETTTTSIDWAALREPYPMIVILRPSNNAQERKSCWTNDLCTNFSIGIFQLFWICFLSFLFSSTIGGSLFWTLSMVLGFIGVVAMSRGLSIFYCWLAQERLDIRIIEYDNLQEKRMMQRFLGGLTGVLLVIRCSGYKKTQWQESVKMYQQGHQLSRGNVMGEPSEPKKCTQHKGTHSFLFDGVSMAYMLLWFPALGVGMGGSVELGAGVIVLVASVIGQIYLRRGKQLLICKCD